MFEVSAVHPRESLSEWIGNSNGAIVTEATKIALNEAINFRSAADGGASLISITVRGFGQEPDLQNIAIAAYKESYGNFPVVLTDEHGRRFEEPRVVQGAKRASAA